MAGPTACGVGPGAGDDGTEEIRSLEGTFYSANELPGRKVGEIGHPRSPIASRASARRTAPSRRGPLVLSAVRVVAVDEAVAVVVETV